MTDQNHPEKMETEEEEFKPMPITDFLDKQ